MAGESGAEVCQDLGLAPLHRLVVEAAAGVLQRLEEHGLAMAPPPGHDAQRGPRPAVRGEARQLAPFPVPVEDPARLRDHLAYYRIICNRTKSCHEALGSQARHPKRAKPPARQPYRRKVAEFLFDKSRKPFAVPQ